MHCILGNGTLVESITCYYFHFFSRCCCYCCCRMHKWWDRFAAQVIFFCESFYVKIMAFGRMKERSYSLFSRLRICNSLVIYRVNFHSCIKLYSCFSSWQSSEMKMKRATIYRAVDYEQCEITKWREKMKTKELKTCFLKRWMEVNVFESSTRIFQFTNEMNDAHFKLDSKRMREFIAHEKPKPWKWS